MGLFQADGHLGLIGAEQIVYYFFTGNFRGCSCAVKNVSPTELMQLQENVGKQTALLGASTVKITRL